jgi:hypothetical protein
MICVLTGDLVQSTRMPAGHLENLMAALAKEADNIRRWTSPASPRMERYRGDGWQLALLEPADALRASLLLRASIKRVDQEADTRIAFGFGEGVVEASLAESRGSAFERSGKQLERIKGADRWAVAGASGDLPFFPLIQALFAACEALCRDWTSKQAEVFARVADSERENHKKPTYSELATALGVTRQTAQEHFAKSNGRALLRSIQGFEQALGKDSAR